MYLCVVQSALDDSDPLLSPDSLINDIQDIFSNVHTTLDEEEQMLWKEQYFSFVYQFL